MSVGRVNEISGKLDDDDDLVSLVFPCTFWDALAKIKNTEINFTFFHLINYFHSKTCVLCDQCRNNLEIHSRLAADYNEFIKFYSGSKIKPS